MSNLTPTLSSKRRGRIFFGCCAVFFCAASVFGQGFDSCTHWKEWKYDQPQSAAEAQLQYDTLQLYIKRCAASDNRSWDVFTTIDGAVQRCSSDKSRYDHYREWLISVLYLNTVTPEYFCACLGSIAGTYQYGKYNPLGYLTVLDYVRKNHRECWGPGLDKEFTKDSLADFQSGSDPNHLPPLDSLGLGFLLETKAVDSPKIPLSTKYLASFTSSPNPFDEATTIEFTVNRMAYIQLAIYDVLGHLVWGDGTGSSLEAGTHTIHLDGKSLPSGTLYARIATGFGEVKTLKLIHE
jgi:hypothetical protein